MTWPEKAELAATIQQMLKTVPVGMFALARDAVDEICLFDARGVRFTITPPIYGLGATAGASGYPVRTIFKPVSGTVLVSIGGVVPTLGLSSVSTTGRVTFDANKTRAITAITKAVQAVISCAGHTFVAGESVHLSGVVGMVEINGLRGLIVSVVANVSITVAINSAGFTAYTSGGTANTRPQSGEAVKGGCEFDLPCRFDSDVDATLLTRSVREIGSMEVVELLNP